MKKTTTARKIYNLVIDKLYKLNILTGYSNNKLNEIELFDEGDEKYKIYTIYYKDENNWKVVNVQDSMIMEVTMKLSNTQKLLIEEMKKQNAPAITLNGIIERLKTEKQQKAMLDYLIKTREIPIPTGTIIMKSIEIMKTV